MWKRLAIAAGLLALLALLLNRLLGGPDHSDRKSQLLRAQLTSLGAKVQSFADEQGRLPISLSELLAVSADGRLPYARPNSLVDPWGAPIYFRLVVPPHRFVLFSLGEDGVLGGSGNSLDRQATGIRNGH